MTIALRICDRAPPQGFAIAMPAAPAAAALQQLARASERAAMAGAGAGAGAGLAFCSNQELRAIPAERPLAPSVKTEADEPRRRLLSGDAACSLLALPQRPQSPDPLTAPPAPRHATDTATAALAAPVTAASRAENRADKQSRRNHRQASFAQESAAATAAAIAAGHRRSCSGRAYVLEGGGEASGSLEGPRGQALMQSLAAREGGATHADII